MQSDQTAARMIAEMFEAQSWNIPKDCANHPSLGPAIVLKNRRYHELRRGDFREARIASNAEAIEFILKATGHD